MAKAIETLTGEETLIACWRALALLSPNAGVTRSPTATVAVFPSWTPMNNAIVPDGHDVAAAVATASELQRVYANAGVGVWALWLPSACRDFDAPDEVDEVGTLARDTTTLVMRVVLPERPRFHEGVVRISRSALDRIANDEPVPENELGTPDLVPGLSMWAMIRDDVAVSCAYTFIHGEDCGVYAVGTLPVWRRRGFAARAHGARTFRRCAARRADREPAIDSHGTAAVSVARVRARRSIRGMDIEMTDAVPEMVIGDSHSHADSAALQAAVHEFNFAATGYRDDRGLSRFVRDDKGELVAGIEGFTWGGYARIDYFWVHENLRGRGIGTRLLAAAENEARRRGCRKVVLDTHSFQAPELYRALGYREVGTSNDVPVGFSETHFEKLL